MDEHLSYIDNLFESGVQRHSELPSGKVWEQLEKSLQKRNVSSITRKYKKWKWVAGLLFVFSIGLGLYSLQLNLKYKREIREIKPRTSDPDDKNTSSDTMVHAMPDANQIRSRGLSSAATANQKKSIGEGMPPGKDKSATGTELMPEAAIMKISKENRKQHPMADLLKIHSARNLIRDENKSSKPVNQSAVIHLPETSKPKETILHAGDKRLNDFITEPDTSRGFALNKLSFTQIDSNAVSSKNEPVEMKARLIRMPPSSLTVKPLHAQFSKITNSGPIDMPIAKSIVRLKGKNLHPEKWTAGVFYSRHIVYADIRANHPDFREDNYLQIKNHESNRSSTITGLVVTRKIVSNLSIASGMSLSTYSTDINGKPLVARKDNNGKISYRMSTSSGYAYYSINGRPQPSPADSIRTLTSTTTVKYISVPIGLQYNFYLRRLVFTPAVLVDANFKLSGKIKTIQSQERTYVSRIEGLKSRYSDGNIGLGIGYSIKKTMVISLIPSARLSLSNPIEKGPVITRSHSFGLAARLNFAF